MKGGPPANPVGGVAAARGPPGGCFLLPYAALVRHPGSETLHLALELSVLSSARGHPLHVHVEGLRGTGKTTVIRAAARLLPAIVRVADCPYNCDPARPHCPLHRGLAEEALRDLGTEVVPAPFLEISPSAKIGTVVGSVDLGRLTDAERPQAALLPGTLARAHRGVVFVDEVNRLADTSPELADALLDVMGTKPGRLQIEEAGLPQIVLPCRATVWAASNPDEEPGPLSDIRRQLADRFDVAVAMRRPAEPPAVVAVLAAEALAGESTLAALGDAAPPAARSAAAGEPAGPPYGGPATVPAREAALPEGPARPAAGVGQGSLSAVAPSASVRPDAPGADAPRRDGPPARPDATHRLRLELQAQAFRPVPPMPPALAERLARAYCEFQIESLRAVQAWQATARLRALREGRAEVAADDCRAVAPLVLRHRLETDELARLLHQWEGELEPGAGAVALAAAVAPAGRDARPDDGAAEGAGAWDGGFAPEALGEDRAGEWLAVPAGPPGDRAGTAGPWWRRLLPAAWRGGAGGPAGSPFGRPARAQAGTGTGGPIARDGPAAPRTAGAGLAPGRGPAFPDPALLPPVVPRNAARFLADLPPGELLTPSQAPGPRRP